MLSWQGLGVEERNGGGSLSYKAEKNLPLRCQ